MFDIRKRMMCTDQTVLALIQKTRYCRMRKNRRESMSKWNYVIGAREPVSRDRCLRK